MKNLILRSSRHSRRRPLSLLAISQAALLAVALGACGDDTAADPSGPAPEIVLHGEAELFPGLDASTGLQPPGSPVQASFALSAKGAATVDAVVVATGSKSDPEIVGVSESGAFGLAGGFALIGTLKVEIDGFPSYEGPIPGIENIDIPFEASTAFDPFAADGALTASAPIPATQLPPIPLPAGLPGSLIVEVAEGSVVSAELAGECAAVEGDQISYVGQVNRGGTLVLRPSVVIEIPLLDAQVFPIPDFTVDLALGTTSIVAEGAIESVGSAPKGGAKADAGACDGGAGGAGAGDTSGSGTSGSGGSGGASSTSVTTTSRPERAGVTASAAPISSSAIVLEPCIEENCCATFDVCTSGGTDADGCNACIDAGGGPLCDDFLACFNTCATGVHGICDSGVGLEDEAGAACRTENCCAEFSECSDDGADVEGCIACFEAGGGPLCDDAILCGDEFCGG